jgi:spore coat protein U-like protein
MKRFLIALAASATLAFPIAATAGTSPQKATFGVSAAVISSCVFGSSTITDLAFGSYDPLSTTAVMNQPTSFTYTCDTGASSISLTATGANDGTVSSTSYAMANPKTSTYLGYSLYTNSTCTGVPLSDSFNFDTYGSGGGTSFPQEISLCGSIPTGQTSASVGNYVDTVTLKLTFS